MAIAMSWVNTVSAISVSMVLPGVLGYWLDQRLKTRVVFTALGFGLGLAIGILRLLQLSQSSVRGANDDTNKQASDDDGK